MQLIRYDTARKAVAEARRVDEVKKLRQQASAVKAYAMQAKDRQLLDHAIDIRERAEIRGGELLIDMAEKKERRDHSQRSHAATSKILPPKLSDLGITKTESSRWQAKARLTLDDREQKIAAAKKKAHAALDGIARQTRIELRAADERRIAALSPVRGKFKTLIVDPPWDYETLSIAGRAAPGYATMTHEELLSLNVQQWAEPNCHLYLWVTNNFMTRGVELMARWGFEHKTVLTWKKLSRTGKPWFGLGSYFRNATEHALFGVCGELRTRVGNIPTIFEAPIKDHSEKPDAFYGIVKRASHLPAGELFQRHPRANFVNIFQAQSEMMQAAE